MTASLLVSLALCGAAPTTVSMPGGEFFWPQFRGPGGEGHVTQTGLPLEWTDSEGVTKNIAWKSPIDGLGWSSPVINGDQVWITTAVELPLPPAPAVAETPAPAPRRRTGAAPPTATLRAKPAAKPEPVYPPISLRAPLLRSRDGQARARRRDFPHRRARAESTRRIATPRRRRCSKATSSTCTSANTARPASPPPARSSGRRKSWSTNIGTVPAVRRSSSTTCCCSRATAPTCSTSSASTKRPARFVGSRRAKDAWPTPRRCWSTSTARRN